MRYKLNLKWPHPADVVTVSYQVLILIIIVLNLSRIPYSGLFALYHIGIIAFLLWLPHTADKGLWAWLRNWNPLIIIPTNFSELHYLVHNVNPIDWDQALIQLDLRIFGIHPTLWLEQYSYPWLTEYLQLVYTSFYFLPIMLGVILYLRKEFSELRFFIFVIVFGFYTSYIGYFMFPAIGPRFTLDHLQTSPVTGLWLTEGIRQTLDKLENIQRDAFPSGHTEMTLLTMIYAWKYSKPYFWILAVTGTSLIASTVYLRYHYVADILGGIILTILVVIMSRPLYNYINKFKLNKNSAK